jgi:hypothetical protein
MGTIRFLPGDRPGRQPLRPSRRQPHGLAGRDEEPPGPELSSGHQAFLATWFQKLGGERAAPGHRGRYAVVRQGATEQGVVAVDADLGIWFTALAGCSQAEDSEHVRRLQRDLSGLGFRYSEHGILASLFFNLVHAAFQGAAGARQGAPWGTPPRGTPPPTAEVESPALATACASTRGPSRLGSAIAAWLAEPVGADREDGRQPRDGSGPGAAAVGRGKEVA